MCRSSTKLIGSLLLLWLGVVLPATEQQLAHVAADAPVVFLSELSAPATGSASAIDQRNGSLVSGSNTQGYSVSPDLSDYDVDWRAEFPLIFPHVSEPSVGVRLISRSPDPQERPPKIIA